MNNELRILINPQEDDPGFYTVDIFDNIKHIAHFRDESLPLTPRISKAIKEYYNSKAMEHLLMAERNLKYEIL